MAETTLGSLLARNARLHGARPALAGDFGTLAHAQLQTESLRIAAALRVAGVRPGDRIATLAANRPEGITLLYAAAEAGATLVPLNWRASAEETAALLDLVAPALVCLDMAFEPLAGAWLARHGSVPAVTWDAPTLRVRGWHTLRGGPPAAAVTQGGHPLMLPVVGMDGRPRCAVLSHEGMLASARSLAQAWQLTAGDAFVCLVPLFHMTGLGLALAAHAAGGGVVLCPRFEPTEALQAVHEHGGTFTATFAPMLAALLDAAVRQPGQPLQSLRLVTGLEAPDTIAQLKREVPGARFWSGYGQTEIGGVACTGPWEDCPGSAGRALTGVQWRIENEAGDEASVGEAGEILARGPTLLAGTWEDAGQGGTFMPRTATWHRTGDLGRLDAQGRLWFTGRAPARELIKTGGENVLAAEVEAALRACSGVAQAVAFGVEDARWGEAIWAVCSGPVPQSPQAMADALAHRLARFKIPKRLIWAETLPRLSDGRVDRAAVKQRYQLSG